MFRNVVIAFVSSLLVGCSTHVFHENMTVSTKSKALAISKELGQVEARDCNTAVLGYSISMNPAKIYRKILEETQAMNGDAVIDFQMRSDGFTLIYPFYWSSCWKATGTAVKFQKAPHAKSSWDSPGTLPDTTSPKLPSKWDSTPDK